MAVSRGPQGNLFVFYGDEDFFLDRGIEVVRRWPDRTLICLDGEEGVSEAEIVKELETQSFDETPRTVLVENAHKVKESKGRILRQYADNVRGSTSVLVAILRSDKMSDMWSYVGGKGKITEHKKFKPWPDKMGQTEYEKWFELEAKRVGLGLDKGVSELVFQMCGDDLYRLQNELKKLYTLVGNGNKVTTKHVASVIAVTPRSEPKDVIEATLAKNPKAAMNALSQVYKTMGDEASIPILYGLMRETLKTLSARQMVDKKTSDEDIAVALGMNPWRCKTFFLPMVKKHNQIALIEAMRKLCKLDEYVKGSSRSKRTLVELTILSIAG